jgi:hypothetical protein
VDKAISQCRRQTKHHGTVSLAIPGRYDAPAFGQSILANLSIKHELIETSLHKGRRSVNFIEKKYSRTISRSRQE